MTVTKIATWMAVTEDALEDARLMRAQMEYASSAASLPLSDEEAASGWREFVSSDGLRLTFAVGWRLEQQLREQAEERLRLYGPECECGSADSCPRHSVLTEVERAAANALHADERISVGNEGTGFYAGQAEDVILSLRRAGFEVVRAA